MVTADQAGITITGWYDGVADLDVVASLSWQELDDMAPAEARSLTAEECAAVLARIDWPRRPSPELVSGRDKLYERHGMLFKTGGS